MEPSLTSHHQFDIACGRAVQALPFFCTLRVPFGVRAIGIDIVFIQVAKSISQGRSLTQMETTVLMELAPLDKGIALEKLLFKY